MSSRSLTCRSRDPVAVGDIDEAPHRRGRELNGDCCGDRKPGDMAERVRSEHENDGRKHRHQRIVDDGRGQARYDLLLARVKVPQVFLAVLDFKRRAICERIHDLRFTQRALTETFRDCVRTAQDFVNLNKSFESPASHGQATRSLRFRARFLQGLYRQGHRGPRGAGSLSGAGRACTSAARTRAPCIILPRRSSTMRWTRRWRASPTASRSISKPMTCSRSATTAAAFPSTRIPSSRTSRRSRSSWTTLHSGRKVRGQGLRHLRRPARRRFLGRQRPLRLDGGGSRAGTGTATRCASSAASRSASSRTSAP